MITGEMKSKVDAIWDHLADALLQYLNSTTGIGDEIFLSDDGMSVVQRKEVFRNIFMSLGQDQHYNMMKGTQT